jgi:hypothetical protein
MNKMVKWTPNNKYKTIDRMSLVARVCLTIIITIQGNTWNCR